MCDSFDAIILRQCEIYPLSETRDIVKALYQAVLGCGHLVSGGAEGLQWLRDEAAACARDGRAQDAWLEPLGTAYCRAHLRGLAPSGLSVETLYALFTLSGQTIPDGRADLEQALTRVQALADAGRLPVSGAAARAYIAAYHADGLPQVSHSKAFRAAYRPAYRVIGARFAAHMPVYCALDKLLRQKARVLLAIEGGSASGKTSLAAELARVYDCNVFHMDDFFLQKHQRTPRRYGEPGGNVDRERFSAEVLAPLQRGEAFSYRVFDCARMALGERVAVSPKPLNIIEGAYSMHPALCGAYDLSVFMDIPAHEQAARILLRNGAAMQQRFLNEWIPLEKAYFDATDAQRRCDIVLRA